MRLAYLVNPTSGNGFYRGTGPLSALSQYRGHSVVKLFNDKGELVRTPLEGIQVLHVHRDSRPAVQQLAAAARNAGAAVVWDEDDDSGSIPRSVVSYRHLGGMAWERRLRQMRQLFRHVDVVTTPSPVLAERLHGWGAPEVRVVENHVPDQFLGVRAPAHDGVTIGWVAAREHAIETERLPIRNVLQRLLDERADVRVVSIGLGLGLQSERYRHVELVPYMQLAEAAAAFDIGIAPLADIDFNRARSNVKLKEYAAAGVPWLASPVRPYADMGERQGGRLVADDRWHEELSRLIDKGRERRKLAKAGRKWVAGETLMANVTTWEAVYADAIERARARSHRAA
jgi:glycosyltransferase involved in cell wall biosynthesis